MRPERRSAILPCLRHKLIGSRIHRSLMQCSRRSLWAAQRTRTLISTSQEAAMKALHPNNEPTVKPKDYRMNSRTVVTILISVPLFSLPAFSQLQGDLIGGPPATNTPSTSTAAALPAPSTNAPAERILGFDQLAGFPFEINEELGYNTNRPA